MTEINKEEIIAKTKVHVLDLLKRSIRPEFFNRIDEVVMFEPLSRKDINEIVKLQLEEIKLRLKEAGVILTATDEAIDWLGQLGFDPQYGARPLKRVIQKKVLNELSKRLLAGELKKDQEIVLDEIDSQLIFRNPVAK